ncbi:hydrolase [Betaproteobacteria bacterium]|nr:hydrolase [Betaproteobacteria bacterium]
MDKPKRFELLVFDWDGTLFDSTEAIARSIQETCRDFSLPEPSMEQACYVIGLELTQGLRHFIPDISEEQIPLLVSCYRQHYLAVDQNIPLFAGIKEMIEDLHTAGFKLAVATGKNRRGLERAFANTGLRPYFTGVRCGDDCPSKPNPQMLEELMRELAVPRDRTLMIGDTTHDMQLAVNAGVPRLAVSYGAHPRAELTPLEPLACLDDVAQLSLWLKQNG